MSLDASLTLRDGVLTQAIAGDENARRQLFRAHVRPVHAFLWRLLGSSANRDDVADLAQDTFLKVFRALSRFDASGPASLSTWILTIASRTALNAMRAKRLAPEELTDELAAPGSTTPERALEQKQLGERLQAAMETLPAEYRAAFVLYEYHALTYEEVSQVMETEVGTVRSRLSRARAHLRTRLGKDALDE